MNRRHPPARPPVVISDPRAIKALAHPARIAVLDELFAGRDLTATECGELVGMSASAMSYHLRALAKWGLIERVESAADGRERPWRAAGATWRVETPNSTAGSMAESMLALAITDRLSAEVTTWVALGDHEDAAWRETGVLMNTSVWLTAEEAVALTKIVHDAVEPYRGRRLLAERPDGARRNRVAFFAFPNDKPPARPDDLP